MLEPRFLLAQEAGMKLVVDLDGTEGYATSFLEEAFGGLARKYSIASVLATLDLVSLEETDLLEEILSYIREANNQ